MAKFKIEITETFQKQLIVEAPTKEAAIEIKKIPRGHLRIFF